MRFFVTGEQRSKILINTLVLMFLAYIALLGISNALLYFHKMDLSVDSVVSYYLGSEQDFTQPKSYQSLLEVTHFHLFAMGMLVLTLTHLMLMTEIPVLLKVWLSILTYGSAILDEASGWLIRFAHPNFAYLKIVSFLILESSLGILIIVISISLIQARMQIRRYKTHQS